MKTLLATTAIALLATIGQAHAVNFGDTTNNNSNAEASAKATANAPTFNTNAQNQNQGQQQGQAQGQIQGQGQLQGQGQDQGQGQSQDDNWSLKQNFEAAATSGSLGLGGNSFGAAVGECPTWGVGRGQSWGIGGSGGAVPGTGQGLFSRNTTEETFSPYCATVKAAATFRVNGQVLQAVKLECTLPDMRYGYDMVDPSTCAGVKVMEKVLVRTETETVASAYSDVPAPAHVVAKAPVMTPAPQPVAAATAPSKPDFASCNGAADETACLNRKSRG